MIFKMKKKEPEKVCCYEEYDSKTKKMKAFGKHADYKAGRNFVCEEHVA